MNKNTWSGNTEAYVAVFDPNSNTPVGEMLKYDARLLGNTGSTGASTEKIIHSKILLINGSSSPTPLTQNRFLNLSDSVGNKYISTSPDYFSGGDISDDYKDCFWDIYENDILIAEKLHFTAVTNLYNYLSTVISNDGTNYTQNAYGVVYDIINNDLEGIYKIYGLNMFRHLLSGNHKGNPGTSLDSNNINWSYFNDWVEEVYINTGLDIAHKYSNGDEQAIKLSKNYKKSFGQIHSSIADNFYINNGIYMYNINTSAITTNNSGYCSQNYTASKYCVRDINNLDTWKWIDFNDISSLNNYILNNDINNGIIYSIIALYVFEHKSDSNKKFILIKPINIDNVYLNYFDTSKYDLYRIRYARDKYSRLKKIDTSSLEKSKISDVVRLLKSDYYDDNFITQIKGKYGIQTEFEYRFFIKDKITKEISPISKMVIKFKNNYKRNNVIDIRIE